MTTKDENREKESIEKAKKAMYKPIIYCYLIGFGISVLTPDNVMSNSSIRTFANVISGITPFVTEVENVTNVPATVFIASAIFLVNIIGCVVMFLRARHEISGIRLMLAKDLRKQPISKKISLFIGGPMLLLMCWYTFYSGNFFHRVIETNWRTYVPVASKIGMGTVGGLYLLAIFLPPIVALIYYAYFTKLEIQK